jgi:uncharacterized protein
MSTVERDAVLARHRHQAPWPYAELDVADIRAGGQPPTPVRELVLKIHQRCNLACDYCYVYTQADQSWRDRPAAMSDEIWQAALGRLSRHVRRHKLNRVRIVLHGGEPLLFGADRLGRLARAARAVIPGSCAVEIGLQTNGILLDPGMMAVLRRHRISVGLSVDGPPAVHDRHRARRNGSGSFAGAQAAAALLRRPENRSCYAGILCVVAPDTDPVACYEQLVEFEPPMIDFLFPHANWQYPPSRPGPSSTPYADWLTTVFDRWWQSGDGVRIRLFDDIVAPLVRRAARSEQVGLSPNATLVVETDGAIEQIDALKSTYSGACDTGLDVRRHELDDALDDPGIVARQIGVDALPDSCQEGCQLVSVCGGGHYAHRYDARNGFRNPSVYCEDLQRLIEHITRRVRDLVRQRSAAR